MKELFSEFSVRLEDVFLFWLSLSSCWDWHAKFAWDIEFKEKKEAYMQETSYIASSLGVKQNKIQLKPGSYFIKAWGFVLITFAGLIMK